MTPQIREATRADFPGIIALLARCELYTESVTMGAGVRYWICVRDGQIVGAVGTEHTAKAALLRSMAVAPEARAGGVAALLIGRACAFLLGRGISDLYIFTGDPSPWAERWEAEPVPPRQLAAALLASPQVQSGLKSGWIDEVGTLAWRLGAERLFRMSSKSL